MDHKKHVLDKEKSEQRHLDIAGMGWVTLLALILVAILSWIWQRQSHSPPAHPERFLESTVPTTR